MASSDLRPLLGSALLPRARLPRALPMLRAAARTLTTCAARRAPAGAQPARRVHTVTAAAKRTPEEETQELMMEEARTKGWVVDNLPVDSSELDPQRIWGRKSLRGTKYEGALRPKNKSVDDAGNGIPDGLLFAAGDDIKNRDLLAVIELKATPKQMPDALKELDGYCSSRSTLLMPKGKQRVLGVAAVGNRASGLTVEVVSYNLKVLNGRRQPVRDKYGALVKTFPTPEQAVQYLEASDKAEPVVTDSLLAERAKKFNQLFRDAHITDSKRPAVIGALMVALWYAGKSVERKDTLDSAKQIESHAVQYCREAFAHANDPLLVDALVSELNVMLTQPKGPSAAEEILRDLRFLGVGNMTLSADFLGQLYEEFFRYTGGNTIGQVFTPRFVTTLMAQIAQVTLKDTVLDPCAGTGGFLIAAAHQAQTIDSDWDSTIDILKNKLWGFESERVTAALCVVNMIVRGDGKSRIFNQSCMDTSKFPTAQATVVLMNPPFLGKSGSLSVEAFINRGLDGLQNGGRLLSIVPDSVLFGVGENDTGAAWRQKMLAENTLEAVIQLPHFTFAPHAKVDTHIIVMKKGTAGKTASSVVKLYRLHDAGLVLCKGILQRIDEDEDENMALMYAAEFITGKATKRTLDQQLKKEQNMKAHVHASVPLSSIGAVDWSVGHNVPWTSTESDILLAGAKNLVMQWAGSNMTRAREFAEQRAAIADNALKVQDFKSFFSKKIKDANNFRVKALADAPNTLGAMGDIVVGQDLTVSDLDPGKGVLVSSSMYDNGVTGVYDMEAVLEPPFITVTLKGGPGLAFVHTQPCAVLSTCLVLKPVFTLDGTRAEVEQLAEMFLIAALITSNSWRFNYARKCTRERISVLPLDAVNNLTTAQRAGLVAQVAQLLPMITDVHSGQ